MVPNGLQPKPAESFQQSHILLKTKFNITLQSMHMSHK
jgi:hypothetical protein